MAEALDLGGCLLSCSVASAGKGARIPMEEKRRHTNKFSVQERTLEDAGK